MDDMREAPSTAPTGKLSPSADKSLAELFPSRGDGLRHAAQPDVVLSQERDLYYADTLLGENASELLETLLGSRRATLLAPELKAVSSCLYFGLTNFAGKQTLGQEYCNISLARGGSTLPGVSLRVYTLLRVAVPYLQERMREGWHGLWSVRHPFRGGAAAAATLAAARARARAQAALAPPVGIAASVGVARDSGRAVTLGDADSVGANVSGGGDGGNADADAIRSRLLSREESTPVILADDSGRHSRWRRLPMPPTSLLTALRRLLAWARRKRPAMSAVLEWVLRLHLVAFYFDGRFANVAMRAVGARLTYVRPEQEEPRAQYAILGLLLFIQVSAEAASAGAAVTERWRAPPLEAVETPARSEGFFTTGGGIRVDLPGRGDEHDPTEGIDSVSSRVPAVPPERTPTDAPLFPLSRRRCSLCMSPRENAAATPCGHLFCWECIVGWCQTSPECPLCRQPATPQSIVCVYQYA